MIKYIKDKWHVEEYRRLFSNFVSLSVLQGANYILPLLTLPYLVRVLGAEKFGLLAFATATVTYFMIITDYGFNLSATREVSIHRDDKEKLIEIFSAVMTIKFVLMILSFLLMTLLVFSFEKFRTEWKVYYLTFGMVVGQVLFPVWFFQGLEKMKFITILNMTAKIFFTIAIFIFVKEQSDYFIVPVCTSLGFIIAGLLSLIIIRKELGISFKLQKLQSLTEQMKSGWHIFISNIAISLYTVSTTFILGLFTNNTIVGYYSAGEKIVKAVQGLYSPVSQSIYPFISRKVDESFENGLIFLRKVLLLVSVITFGLSCVLLGLSEYITILLLGYQYTESIVVVKILSFLPFIIALSNIFGIQTMLNFGKNKAFSRILISASILNLILSIILVPVYQHIGSAISVLFVEIFVSTVMFIYLQLSDVKILRVSNV